MSTATFVINTFGKLEPYSPTISRARVRIFYTGHNRNSTYITEEFANKLLATLSYAPVKGIYADKNSDYEDHGKRRDSGRIYGIIPENPNITWEDHTDDDGITRRYACADVLLFTALYAEAAEIIDKGESMEIYARSIKGAWQVVDGRRAYVYSEGHFLGLQVLGDDVEPCFEGAQFFSLYTKLKNLIDDTLEGGKDMNFNFKLSDSKKHEILFNLLNPNFNEAGNWEVKYGLSEVYDDYALCYDYEMGTFCRAYYQKDDEKDTCSLVGEIVKCIVVDVTEAEYAALNLLKTANGGNFEKVDEVYAVANTKIEELTTQLNDKIAEVDTKIVELETVNTTLATKDTELAEKDTTIASLQEAHQQTTAAVAEKESIIVTLTGELSTLKEYKDKIENSAKQALIEKYTALLETETLKTISENIGNYSIIDLEKELAYQAVQKNPNVFSKQADEDPLRIPNGESENYSGATKILMKHKRK